jgi:glutamate-1-semialdehyde 2,1-aminomutase
MEMGMSFSDAIINQAEDYLVGGVSSSFRINPFTGKPLYLRRADGPYIYNQAGNRYVDFFMGHGACPLGHNRPEIRTAIEESLGYGFYAEYDHPLSIMLAQKIIEHIPCAQRVRYVNSGSEGTLLAMRLARGYTGRTKIVRIDGHFHGGHDYALGNNLASKIDRTNPGNRLSTIGHLSAGIPDIIRKTLFLIPWNQPEVFQSLAQERGHEIAAIIMNPIDFNNGCIETSTDYLQAIRDICDQHGIIFILDEILSGFRTGLSCGQGYYGVTPDLCLLGKALTNGFPLAAIAGKKEIMEKIIDNDDPVIAGGTFSGNIPGCAAGLASFRIMESPGFFESWLTRADQFFDQVQSAFIQDGFPARVQHIGCNFYIYVGVDEPIKNYHDFEKLDRALEKSFFLNCIQNGLYFHTDFTVSAMHDEEILAESADLIRAAARKALKQQIS